MSSNPRPMRSTEVTTTRLDAIHPGLRSVDKFHPPSEKFPSESFEQLAAIKKGGKVVLRKKGSV